MQKKVQQNGSIDCILISRIRNKSAKIIWPKFSLNFIKSLSAYFFVQIRKTFLDADLCRNKNKRVKKLQKSWKYINQCEIDIIILYKKKSIQKFPISYFKRAPKPCRDNNKYWIPFDSFFSDYFFSKKQIFFSIFSF